MTAEEVTVLVGEMASAASAGTTGEWRQTWTHMTDGLMDDGSLSDGAYAALPHLIEAAAKLPARQFVDFWVDVGLLVTAEEMPPVPADLEAGFVAALRLAEQAAARSFLTAGAPAKACALLALSCVAFAGHPIATALWDVEAGESHLVLLCPWCGFDTEIPEFFVDPVRPPFDAPELPAPAHVRQEQHPWDEVAAALQEQVLGQEWEPFLRVARKAAAAGVPPKHRGRPSCAWSPAWSRPTAPRNRPQRNGPAR